MSGFFPVMMFGLPGACLAMYQTARPERRAATGGLLLSLALTSFLTGVTEPIEFTFMFLAPVLYVLHAIATGLAMVLMNAFGVRLGFSFSAGLFDYLLNFSHAQRPLLLLPIGASYFGLYYLVFRVCIVRFNLATPGRETDDAAESAPALPSGGRAEAFVTALGGPQNLVEVEACTTRLRLVLADNQAIDEPALKGLGARGVLRVGGQGLQVVLGTEADLIAGNIRDCLRRGAAARDGDGSLATALLAALGGSANVLALERHAGRILLRAARLDVLDAPALERLGVRAIARTGEDTVQLLITRRVDPGFELLVQRPAPA